MTHRHRLSIAALLVLAALLLAVLPASAQSKTDVKVWIGFTDTRLDWAKARADEFNTANPDYNVSVEGYGNYEDLFTAYSLAQQQGNPPAVVQYFEVGTQPALDSGYFTSVADALNGRTEVLGQQVNADDFIGVAANYYTVNGKLNSLPWNTSTAIMFVNQDMLKKAGVDTIPATWQDVSAACDKLMALADKPQGCVTWPNYGWFYEQWMAQQNAPLANNDNGRTARATEVLLDSDPSLAIARWWQELYSKGQYVYTGVQRDWDGSEALFQSGKVAMVITSSGDLGSISAASEQNGVKFVTAPMPYNADAGYTGNLIGGASLWLTKGLDAKVQDGALGFMLYLDDTANAADWHKLSGYVSIRKSAFDQLTKDGYYTDSPNATTAYTQLANSKPTVATQGALLGPFPEVRNIITQAFEDIMLKNADPVATMQQAKADADKALADYNALYETEATPAS